jgi:hypothetical protein
LLSAFPNTFWFRAPLGPMTIFFVCSKITYVFWNGYLLQQEERLVFLCFALSRAEVYCWFCPLPVYDRYIWCLNIILWYEPPVLSSELTEYILTWFITSFNFCWFHHFL